LTLPSGQAKAAAMASEPMIEAGAVGKPPKGRKGGLGETTRFLLFVFLFALILRSFIVAPFVIPSGSMLPRMMIGDFLFVAKWPYGYSRFSMPFGIAPFQGRILASKPERGDVVVFRYPGGGDEDYVKRLIGLPGDRLQVREGALWLNNKPVPRVRIADYLMPVSPNSPCRYVDPSAARMVTEASGKRFCAYRRYRETLPGGRSYNILDQMDEGAADNTQVFTVPAGNYFMMGDNRDDSEDSRFPREEGGVGYLPADYLIGRALITFFSTDGSAQWAKPWTWLSAARWERIGETF
jgi:signal peptidase I